jgi:hypothetical protein
MTWRAMAISPGPYQVYPWRQLRQWQRGYGAAATAGAIGTRSAHTVDTEEFLPRPAPAPAAAAFVVVRDPPLLLRRERHVLLGADQVVKTLCLVPEVVRVSGSSRWGMRNKLKGCQAQVDKSSCFSEWPTSRSAVPIWPTHFRQAP